MVQFEFCKSFFLLTTLHCVVTFTNGEHTKFNSIDIPNELSSVPLTAFTENDWNGAKSIENEPKSRRKRYVAFPEGSSFSVILFIQFNISIIYFQAFRISTYNFFLDCGL